MVKTQHFLLFNGLRCLVKTNRKNKLINKRLNQRLNDQ